MSDGTSLVRASDGHRYEYDVLALPAFPTMPLDVAIDEAGLVWFPVRHICEDGLHVDPATQQDKVTRAGGDYEGLWRRVPFHTVKGQRDLVALEWEGLGLFFSGIQESRVSENAKDYIRIFRRQAMRELNKILARHPRAGVLAARGDGTTDDSAALQAAINAASGVTVDTGAALDSPRLGKGAKAVRKRLAQQLQDERMEYLEDRVAEHAHSLAILLNGQGTPATRVAHCPCCGAPIRLEVEGFRFVPAGPADGDE